MKNEKENTARISSEGFKRIFRKAITVLEENV